MNVFLAMSSSLSFNLIFFTLLTRILLQSTQISCTQNTGKIAVGQSLYASTSNSNGNASSLISPSGDFALGFQKVDSNSSLYLLSIWYAKIPDTIVWYANEGVPVLPGSKLTVTVTEGLTLTDPSGTHLWNTTYELSGAGVVKYGFLNDTGNFVLQAGDDSSDTPLWQSFDYPTDTLLPTQVILQQNGLYSRMSETNFTRGKFQLLLQSDGNLVMNTRELATGFRYPPYYATMTVVDGNSGSAGGAGGKLVYSESGDMYVLLNNGSRFDLIPQEKLVSDKNFYQRVTLNSDGVLTWNYHPKTFKNAVGWSTIQSFPDDICTAIPAADNGAIGACGLNSICRIDGNHRPVCECPQGYSLIDPGDQNGDCKPDFGIDFCRGGAHQETYKLVRLQNTAWSVDDYAQLSPCGEEECQSSCLNDCFCAAAIAKPDNTCFKKNFPLSFGVQDNALAKTTWLKIGNGNGSTSTDVIISPVSVPGKTKNKLSNGVIALLGGSAGANFILISAICLIFLFVCKKKTYKMYDGSQSRFIPEYGNVHCFRYKELENATNGFNEEIGRGAFGVVYKGIIGAGDHSTVVAVKKLDRAFQNGDKEFTAEVNVIGQTHHKNLVRLLGFCKEEDQRLLVYEYLCNGTVAEFLFGDLRPTWMSRVKIAQGVAKGLLYLHDECSKQIIHCDIKPQNILLDDSHNARISDFGLAKLLVLNQNQTTTAVRGTKGYVAPEWFRNKPVTVKVDVYSFGVLLLELICCRRSVCIEIIGDEKAILTDWAFDCYQSGLLETLVDDRDALTDRSRLERFVMVALWCIQEEPSVRPTMMQVTQMLEGVLEVPNPPCPTSFTVTV